MTREQLHAMARTPGAFDGFFAFEGREAPPKPSADDDGFVD